ncbi:hypothetical protein VZH09_07380 [Synechococcus elongatus IITB7]|uniref:hypothetical protein n=1 Tax=Synechococcus elongatus TaxID=32046 RepID=UPI0030D5B5FA
MTVASFSDQGVNAESVDCVPIKNIKSLSIKDIGSVRTNPKVTPNNVKNVPSNLKQEMKVLDQRNGLGDQYCWYKVAIGNTDEIGWVAHEAVQTVVFLNENSGDSSSLIDNQSNGTSSLNTQSPQPNNSSVPNGNIATEEVSFGDFLRGPSTEWNILQLLNLIAVIAIGILNYKYQKDRKKAQERSTSMILDRISKIGNQEQIGEVVRSTIRFNNNHSQDLLQKQTELILQAINKISQDINLSSSFSKVDRPINLLDNLSSLPIQGSAEDSFLEQVISSFGNTNQLFDNNQKFTALGFPDAYSPSTFDFDPQGHPTVKLVNTISSHSLFLRFEDKGTLFLIPNILLNNLSGKISQSLKSVEFLFEVEGISAPMAKVFLERPAEVKIGNGDQYLVMNKGKIIFG